MSKGAPSPYFIVLNHFVGAPGQGTPFDANKMVALIPSYLLAGHALPYSSSSVTTGYSAVSVCTVTSVHSPYSPSCAPAAMLTKL